MSTTPESTRDSTPSTLRSLGSGGVAGLGAALFGYLVTYLLTSSTIENSTASQVLEALGSDISTWKVVGWVFMSAHGVTTTFPGLFGTTSSTNLIEGIEAFSPVLYVVPVVALLAAGALATVVSGASSSRAGALAGAGTTVGYLVFALAGIALFSVSLGESAISPDPVTSALLAGVAYPAVLGTVGGLAAAALR
ncbi:transporter [Haloferax sp. Atlit-12N]|uniref:transporter n=1 Tax=Haloferax sp. Atlit-12N TaxID=2077203 RepID=UPI000E26D3E4|nr:transporter [Haloferax sp. Atlit-12N]RDZ63603.1 transporter [Haloferax sp. Atlit-12N]